MGEGGFGAVFKVQEKERKNHIYAAKMIFDDVKDKEEKVKEFRGKNIIKILYHYMDKEEDFYMIIMELSSVGDLGKLIGTQNKKAQHPKALSCIGGCYRTRTCDPLHVKQVL